MFTIKDRMIFLFGWKYPYHVFRMDANLPSLDMNGWIIILSMFNHNHNQTLFMQFMLIYSYIIIQ